MPTYSQVVDQIIAEIGKADTSITDVVKREVLNAVEHFSTERFWFNEAHATFTASSTTDYALATVAADLMEIDVMTVTVSGAKYDVTPTTYQDISRMDVSGFTGIPTEYAIFGESIRLFPKPNSVYQIDLYYQKRLATLSATGDSNAWTTYGSELIQARAEKELKAKRYRDYDGAVACGRVEEEALQKLREKTERMTASGRNKGNG